MLGLCCQYIEYKVNRNGKGEYVNIVDEKGLQYNQFLKGKYASSQIEQIWEHNAKQLLSIVQRSNRENIKSFRVSSNLFPLYDSLTDQLKLQNNVKSILKEVGKYALSNNMRLTCHPDQFVVISSNKPDVIEKSFRMLDHHAWIFDQMELPVTPYYAINIHGGTKGNFDTLNNSIKKLPDTVRGRLTLENDERSFSVKDLYQVYEESGIPIVFDSHHHTFNDCSLSIEDALNLSMTTWGEHKPLTHLSNTDPTLVNGSFTERRKHSDYVHYVPESQLKANNEDKIDIDLEFKMKNIALFKAVKDFNLKLS
jgi:UV DNA damage endonuclease